MRRDGRREAVSVLDQLGEGADTYYFYHADQFRRLITLLLDDHVDVLRAILDRIRAEAENQSIELDRLQRLTRMVGLVALYSRTEAEELVDIVLDTSLSDLDRSDFAPVDCANRASVCILYELLIAIAKHGLRFDCLRKKRLRNHFKNIV